MSAVLHPKTRALLTQAANSLPTGLLLHGPEGVGKEQVLREYAAKLIGVELDSLDAYPYWIIVKPTGNSIPIESIRELQKNLTLKTPAHQKRCVAIFDAHTLGEEAQNALLKMLEEPASDTTIILTVDRPQQLLITVRSRLQSIEILPPLRSDLIAHFSAYDSGEVNKQAALAGNRVGLLTALLEDGDHPLKSAMTTAKEVVQASTLDRLCLVETLSKDKNQLLLVLDALAMIYQVLMRGSVASNQSTQTKRHAERLGCIDTTRHNILLHGQAKLNLDALMMRL